MNNVPWMHGRPGAIVWGMALVLFDHPDSPNCHKVRLLLSALDLPHERRRVDFLDGGARTPEHLARNPAGQIPVLVHGELALPESNAILVYLADRFRPPLAGEDEITRAEVLRWLFWQSSGASRRIATIGYQRQVRPARGEACDEAVVAREMPHWQREAQALEQRLRRARWLSADHWTVADVGVGAWLEIAAGAGMLAQLPATAEWVRRLRDFAFWRRTPGYELLRGPSWS